MTRPSPSAEILGRAVNNSIPQRLEDISRRLDIFESRAARSLRLIDIIDGDVVASNDATQFTSSTAACRATDTNIPGWLDHIESQLKNLAALHSETEKRLSIAVGADNPVDDEETKADFRDAVGVR